MNQYISKGLNALGLQTPLAQGAFYNYPTFEAHRAELASIGIKTSKDLASYLMNEHGLAALPGSAFGAQPEVLTLRLSSCDYDGAAALAAYQGGEKLDEAFIAKNSPRVKAAVEAFGAFIASAKQSAAA